jgi:signal transduction histidine kinase
MNQFFSLINFFLPLGINRSLVQHRKGSILIFSHLYFMFAIVFLILTSTILYNTVLIPALLSIPCIIISMFSFKKMGNVNVSGNILSIICLSLFTVILLNTGGIKSCYLPWLYAITLIMVLVESLLWACVWFVVPSIACVMLYFLGKQYPNMNITLCTDFDTCLSLMTVGFLMFTNLIVFEKHQVFVLQLFKAKNDELKIQKKKVAEQVKALEEIQEKLTASNQELKTFAYVASHDLKEPLRMIIMYTQLLERKLKASLDSNSQEYMFYITDGVKRMQQLLDNLLEYSLVGRNQHNAEFIDLNDKLEKVKQNLTVRIQETNAYINISYLPTIKASRTEMTQLFQNLMANALKFRKPDVKPVIDICCDESPIEYTFSISDNGIGIKKEDQARVFDLFTRLNARNVYEGTGIGLATCKKILSGLNGRIWLTSTEGVGTTFYFTIPKSDEQISQEKIDEQKHEEIEIAEMMEMG